MKKMNKRIYEAPKAEMIQMESLNVVMMTSSPDIEGGGDHISDGEYN